MTLSIPIWLLIPGGLVLAAVIIGSRAPSSSTWSNMDVVTPLVILGLLGTAAAFMLGLLFAWFVV